MIRDKHMLLQQIHEKNFLAFAYFLTSLIPVALYEGIVCYWLYWTTSSNSYYDYSTSYVMMTNFRVYHLEWIPYYLQYVVPFLWLLFSFGNFLKLKHDNDIETLHNLYHLAMNSSGPIENPYKPTCEMYLLAEDIQKMNLLKQDAVEKSIQNERTKVELITNVSHDLKTPLTAITNYVELLSKEPLNDICKDYVDVILAKLVKLSEMISSVFELSKTASGAATLDLVPLDMNCLIEQVKSDLTADNTEQNDMIRLSLCKESTQFSGDSVSLYRVLQNLIGNALKYSLKGTRIYIQTQVIDSIVQVSIINTANYEMTFAPSDITERFVRGDVSRSTDGNGLGLAIAKTYTEACNGTLEITTEGDQFKSVIHFPSL